MQASEVLSQTGTQEGSRQPLRVYGELTALGGGGGQGWSNDNDEGESGQIWSNSNDEGGSRV